MYEAFFGLRDRPFDLTPDPRYLVLTPAHREALSSIEYGIASRKGITLLVGDAGLGKTTVIRAALARAQSRVHCVHLHNPALTRDEFVEMLAAMFKLTDAARRSKAMLLLELESLLRERELAGETTVLIVDEAQSLPLELLEEVRLLANIETNERKLLSVIMAGQPELALRLNEQALRQLKQRVALRCTLRPLTAHETTAYLAGRLTAAGAAGGIQVFTREAVAAMHEASKGIPRLISVIADNVLLTAFALGARPATRQIVLDVCGDFDLAAGEAILPSVPASNGHPLMPSNSHGRLLLVEERAPVVVAAPQPPTVSVVEPAEPRGTFGGWFAKRRLFSSFFSS